MRFRSITSCLFVAAVGCSHPEPPSKGSPQGFPDVVTTGDPGEETPPSPLLAGQVYLESNDPAGNSILTFARGDDGALSIDRLTVTATEGLGLTAGPDQRIGPLDSDHGLVVSDDGRFLLAVNSGDHTISMFSIGDDGDLTLAGLPVESGGANPVSLGVDGEIIHVVNKSADGAFQPSYAALALRQDTLQLLPDLGYDTVLGGSPSIAFVHPDGAMLFGTEFFDASRQAPAGQIDAFLIGDDGRLVHAPGSPYALPADTSGIVPSPLAVALSITANPIDHSILYVAFPTRNQIGVYRLDPECYELTFIRTVASSGQFVSRFLMDRAGHYLYAVNGASASISTFDLSDPLAPVEIGALELAQARGGRPFVDAAGANQTITSQPFQLSFDADQSHVYVVSQRVTTNADDAVGNYLHTLVVRADGSLAELAEPIDLLAAGVPSIARPQGVLVR
jgi:hypothetical protein